MDKFNIKRYFIFTLCFCLIFIKIKYSYNILRISEYSGHPLTSLYNLVIISFADVVLITLTYFYKPLQNILLPVASIFCIYSLYLIFSNASYYFTSNYDSIYYGTYYLPKLSTILTILLTNISICVLQFFIKKKKRN